MPSDAVNKATRREWRELGFFYDRDDTAKTWRLVGSRLGLLRFRDALLEYVADPEERDHWHYGPYMYLEVMTAPKPSFDNHAIRGSIEDLKRLAQIIGAKLIDAKLGEVISIQHEFATDSPYALLLEIKPDDFDPAAADPVLPKE